VSPELSVQVGLSRGIGDRPFSVDVEFQVPPGITILFGPSGAGKSTILQVIAGLLAPDSGRVALGNEVWSDTGAGINKPPHQRRVAYVFQSLALFPHMTALKNVAYGISRDLTAGERQERAHHLLHRLEVAHLAHRKPRTFSGGEAQRVALARALAIDPQVLLLDEPFSALDRELRMQLGSLVQELVRDLKIPVLQVTHAHGEARKMGDRVILVKDGRIDAEGKVGDVLRDS
jgi:molybdate transport system ATP-binding protein